MTGVTLSDQHGADTGLKDIARIALPHGGETDCHSQQDQLRFDLQDSTLHGPSARARNAGGG